jgi:hypothetical protein
MIGAALGVLADRLWLFPSKAEAQPLTAEAMALRLELSPDEEERLRDLLESLHAEVLSVVENNPGSLRAAVRDAQHRIEATLPPEALPEFHAWIREHHEQLMGRMHGASMTHTRSHGDGPGAKLHHESPPPRR